MSPALATFSYGHVYVSSQAMRPQYPVAVSMRAQYVVAPERLLTAMLSFESRWAKSTASSALSVRFHIVELGAWHRSCTHTQVGPVLLGYSAQGHDHRCPGRIRDAGAPMGAPVYRSTKSARAPYSVRAASQTNRTRAMNGSLPLLQRTKGSETKWASMFLYS